MYSTTVYFLLAQLSCLVSGRTLRSSDPATYGSKSEPDYIIKTTFPLGNGRLGAMPYGPPGAEKFSINVDSLWSGGPFESSDYTGGNPTNEKFSALPGIRDWIFDKGDGNVTAILGSGEHYGSYRTLANFSISIDHGTSSKDYTRSLDLEKALHETSYNVDGADFTTSVFCSYPAEACIYRVKSSKALPKITAKFENQQISQDLFKTTCGTGFARLSGSTQKGPPQGMQYDTMIRVGRGDAKTHCSNDELIIEPGPNTRSLMLVVGAGTDFDQSHGDAEHDYSFKGEDPGPHLESITQKAAAKCYADLLKQHTKDYAELFGAFTLDLPDPNGSAEKETSDIISAYAVDGEGDPFVEALLFDYSRYMLISASRENSLPANLQGRWTEELSPSWSADYHANINLQMNYWVADQTGLARTQHALWNYMAQNWVPRGSETARLLYNASGWVVHNEMNIFGHTGMKDGATWANYPAAAAWMMQHVWDNFDYTQDVAWLTTQGYPLIKGIAEFWLSQLQKDDFSKDGTLVVNPCNSPEHGPTTFGCTHYHQLIFQVFEATLSAASVVSEKDQNFLDQVSTRLEALDKGLHFTSWGGVKEWKAPDSFGFDEKNTHRHLSNLVGWHPGYSISSFQDGYRNSTIQSAVSETLKSRGKGNADDADSGWEKVWRSACWARLNNTEQAYYELRYAIDENFANNGFSMYQALDAPFQIDANYGLGGAMLSMLVVDLPLQHGSESDKRTVVLGPAIPSIWGGGSVQGLRLRGGRSVDFSWDKNGKVQEAKLSGSGKPVILVNVDEKVLAQG